MTRFYLDYINTWPTMLALLPIVSITAGWSGMALAKRILYGKPAGEAYFWIATAMVCAYLMRRAAL